MKWILHNFWIKLLAALMAFLLWFHVATEREYELELTYTLAVAGLAGDLVLTAPPPRHLVARCRGSGKRLLLLLLRERVWPVDLSAYTRGTVELSLKVQDAPRDDAEQVQFLSIVRNAQFQLDIDRRKQKTVPIIPSFLYETRPGYVRAGPETLDPDSVVLSGPAGALKNINGVKTRTKSFADLSEAVQTEVDLEPASAYNVTQSVDRCRLFADVQPYAEKIFRGIPLTAGRRKDGKRWDAEPDSVSVTIGGGRQALDTLQYTQIQVDIDPVADAGESAYVRPAIQVPSGFRVINVRPDSVLIRFR